MDFNSSPPTRDRACTMDACAHAQHPELDSSDRLSKHFAVLLTIGRHMLEPTGQRSMLRLLLDDAVQGLAARSGVIRLSLPDGSPWQVESAAVSVPNSRYLEAYRKAEVVQTVWDTMRPAVVAQWCRSLEECDQQRSIGDGHAVCTTSFVCVPILLGSQRLGVLSMDFPSAADAILWEYARILSVVAGWIAHDCLVRGLLPPERAVAAPSAPVAPVTNNTMALRPELVAAPSSLLRPPEKTSLRNQIRSIEREAIEKALALSGGNMSAAARQLGITPRMMRYKLKILSIPNVRPSRKGREAESQPAGH